MMEAMATRTGKKWLVIYSPRGPYAARRDSPVARDAQRDGTPTSKFRTLGGACAAVRRLRALAI